MGKNYVDIEDDQGKTLRYRKHVNGRGLIAHGAKVHPQAQPLDETAIDGGEGVQYVLEIKGGLAATLGLVPGDAMVWAGLSAPAEPCN